MTPHANGPVWVAPFAEICGDVWLAERLADGVSVWFKAVCRAENEYVEVGRCSNLQDFVMLHVGTRGPTLIGDFCSITVTPPSTARRCVIVVSSASVRR